MSTVGRGIWHRIPASKNLPNLCGYVEIQGILSRLFQLTDIQLTKRLGDLPETALLYLLTCLAEKDDDRILLQQVLGSFHPFAEHIFKVNQKIHRQYHLPLMPRLHNGIL